ncbi:arylesterase [Rhizobium sp. L1K21]|uniref:arylesterase n=1 Tax=Rhizobium sp. L1K21 TaxID=2954933 RepID=UPI002093DB00|nr:arylesterase [Rhizobium sp. L1K21]MCO6184743.1 arylesterase [Rhizobium sp. L1K21]
MRFKAFHPILMALLLLVGLDSVAQARPLNIVAFGDSLMAGYELAPEDAFPAQLEKLVNENGYDVKITNASVSGDTTANGLSRLDWSIPDGTDGVILELGANDALRGLSPDETRKNLTAIIERLKERGIPVLLAGMRAPPNLGDAYAAEFDAIFPDLEEKYDLAFYPLMIEAYVLDPKLKISDGLHPNAQGVAAMAKSFLPVMEKFLSNISGS